jgi:ectoine hydroxylase-related dioxygenase (phytanoyl-CoA dioxygenase family)
VTQGRLSAAERDFLDRNGYVIRENVFDPSEVAAITAACESLVDRLVLERRRKRYHVGSYTFEPNNEQAVYIKWEGDTDIVHGIEPFAHLDPVLKRWALDPRFVEPMIDFVGDEHPNLFTEKLNLKRPGIGGVNPLHQDYPYWVGTAREPARVATSMLLLDDSSLENGCLQVVPGSHKAGQWRKRTDSDEFGANEIDASAYEDVETVPVPLKAGSMVMFGSLLVHCSAQNTSNLERRALLFSYQPAGYPTSVEMMTAEIEAYRKARAARTASQQSN